MVGDADPRPEDVQATFCATLVDEWFALGTVAAGPMPEGGASRPRPPLELDDFLNWS